MLALPAADSSIVYPFVRRGFTGLLLDYCSSSLHCNWSWSNWDDLGLLLFRETSPLSEKLSVVPYKPSHLVSMLVSDFLEVGISLQLLLGQHLCVTSQFLRDFLPLLSHLVDCLLAGVLAPRLLRLLPPLCLPCLAACFLAPNPSLDLLLHLLPSGFPLIGQLLCDVLNCFWSRVGGAQTCNRRRGFVWGHIAHCELLIPFLHALLCPLCGSLFCLRQMRLFS